MQKVIAINLNGSTYQLDEQGYEALRAYLEYAQAQLSGNPDAPGILRDVRDGGGRRNGELRSPAARGDRTVRVAGISRSVRENVGTTHGGAGRLCKPAYKLQNAVEKVKAKFDGLHHKAH